MAEGQYGASAIAIQGHNYSGHIYQTAAVAMQGGRGRPRIGRRTRRDLFLATFRGSPTANAEGLDRIGGEASDRSRVRRFFRCPSGQKSPKKKGASAAVHAEVGDGEGAADVLIRRELAGPA